MNESVQPHGGWLDSGSERLQLSGYEPLTDADLFDSVDPFEAAYARIFRRQTALHPVYGAFVRQVTQALGGGSDAMDLLHDPAPSLDRVPLIPIRAFREAEMAMEPPSGQRSPKPVVFESSGTTGQRRSRHLVRDPRIYVRSVLRGFRRFYGPTHPPVMGYLPGYLDNPRSSLVAMLRILDGARPGPGIHGDPDEALRSLHAWRDRPFVLFGAAFGLLDLVERAGGGMPALAPGSVVIETGGMKTHRREIPRDQLHRRLSDALGIAAEQVHSEYSMCEMLSQAYCRDGEWFEPVPWLKFQVRHPDRPLRSCAPGEEGKLGFIDLANVHSCSFVLTDDRAVADEQGRVKIMGRWERSPSRGCNYMVDKD